MAFLTDRTLATGVTPTDLIHIVITGDTSQNPAGSSYKATIGQVFNSLSGYCLSDLYVSNIHSCSPLNINPLDEGNVYFGSTSGVTIDIINKRIGLNTNTPNYLIDFYNSSLDTRFYFVESSNVRAYRITGGTNNLTIFGVSTPDGLGNQGGLDFGVRGISDPSWASYGKVNDGFLYSSANSNGLNIISQLGIGTEDYIRFYAGQSANGTIPDMFIQGTGSTRGFIGIGKINPTERLDISGKTKTINFQMTSGASQGYVLLDSDGNGNTEWKKSRNWGSFISTIDQTPSLSGTTYKMSADTGSGSGVTLSANTRFIVSTPGVYNIQFSGQFVKTTNQPSSIYIWLSKNGTPVPNTNTEFTMPQGSNERVVAAWNWVDESFTNNTYYEIEWGVTNPIITMDYDASPLIGPAIPSLIVTVTQA